MASEEELVNELRSMLGESLGEGVVESDSLFTNLQLIAWLDAEPYMEGAALKGWLTKMAHFAGLVNVVDGASSRELGMLIDNAERMVKLYSKLSLGPVAGRSRVGKIVRS